MERIQLGHVGIMGQNKLNELLWRGTPKSWGINSGSNSITPPSWQLQFMQSTNGTQNHIRPYIIWTAVMVTMLVRTQGNTFKALHPGRERIAWSNPNGAYGITAVVVHCPLKLAPARRARDLCNNLLQSLATTSGLKCQCETLACGNGMLLARIREKNWRCTDRVKEVREMCTHKTLVDEASSGILIKTTNHEWYESDGGKQISRGKCPARKVCTAARIWH